MRGWAPDTTSGARICSPLSSVTPVTRPLSHVDRAHRRAGPDRGARRPRRCARSPARWRPCRRARGPTGRSRPRARRARGGAGCRPSPGCAGPAHTPTTPVEAQAPLSTSDSNHSSSRSPTDIVITRNSSSTSRRASPAVRPASRSSDEQVAGALRAERGRRAQHQRAQEARHAREHLLELRVAQRVAGREPGDRLARPLGVVEEEDRHAVRRDRAEGRVERDRLVAEVAQPQLLDDLRLQHRDDVGGARDALARPHLLGHAGAAEDVAALEHAHAQARAREVGGGGEPVVAAADDDRVVRAAPFKPLIARPPSARSPPRAPRPGSTIFSNSSGPATSGGEIWTTGSPRSSARQIRPRLKSSGERKPRSSSSHSSLEKLSRLSESFTSSSA